MKKKSKKGIKEAHETSVYWTITLYLLQYVHEIIIYYITKSVIVSTAMK